MVLAVEWSRLSDDILQMYWPFLYKIVSGPKNNKPIVRIRKEDSIEGSDDDMGCIGGREPSNVDDIKAWNSANAHLFTALILTTTGVARSVLLEFEPKCGRRPGDGKQACLALQSKYQNNSRQRRRTVASPR